MADLAQFFTQDYFSKLLIQSIDSKAPKIILDLGIGDGALTTAALKKWKNAKFYGVDLDKERLKQITLRLPEVSLHNINSLDITLNEKIKIKLGTVDIAICNPPYLVLKKEKKYIALLKKADLPNSINLPSYTSDLIFLAQNIIMLRQNGTLGIIVPDSIVCGQKFRLLRRDLLENHSLKQVIQLESQIFKNTQAKTHILILNKGKSDNNVIELCIANKEGVIENRISVLKRNLEPRMDYKYHKSAIKNGRGITLKEMGVKIQRGNYEKKDLVKKRKIYFHTTNTFLKIGVRFLNNVYHMKKKPVTAQKGDILLSRVGRNCVDKITIVRGGNIAISDCIYKISAPKRYQEIIFKKLISRKGKLYLKKIEHGVCAQFISKKDLEDFKITSI